MSAHTPGPWTVRGGNVIESPSGVNVAKAWMTDDGEECANARLIASAPEMFTALMRLTEKVSRANAIQHSGGTIQPEDWSELYQFQNESKAILAKAEGRAE